MHGQININYIQWPTSDQHSRIGVHHHHRYSFNATFNIYIPLFLLVFVLAGAWSDSQRSFCDLPIFGWLPSRKACRVSTALCMGWCTAILHETLSPHPTHRQWCEGLELMNFLRYQATASKRRPYLYINGWSWSHHPAWVLGTFHNNSE